MEIITPFIATRPQLEILDSRQPVNLFLAGQGSGKSYCAGLVTAIYIRNYPKMRGIICANTYGQLTRSTLFRIREVWKNVFGLTEYMEGSGTGNYVIGKQPPKHFITVGHNFDNYNNIISFDNGAVVYVGSLDNYKALDGIEVCWAVLDETKDTKEEAVKQVIIGRLRQTGLFVSDTGEIMGSEVGAGITGRDVVAGATGREERAGATGREERAGATGREERAGASPAPTMGLPFNPLYIFTSPASVQWINEWFYLNDYEQEINEKIFSETTYFKKEVSNKFVVISSTYHNAKNLPANYISNQKANLHTALQDLLIYGSPFGKSGGEFYKFFDRNKHVGNLRELYPQYFGNHGGKDARQGNREGKDARQGNREGKGARQGNREGCPYNRDVPLLISVDENAAPYFPMGIYQMFGLHLCKIDEICAVWPNNTVNWLCAEFSRRYAGHTAGISIFGDATSQKDDVKREKGEHLYYLIRSQLQHFPKIRLCIEKSNPAVSMRGDFINTVLEKEIFGCKFSVDSCCVKTIADYNNVKENADRSKDKKTITDPETKRSYQPWGHLTDEGDYIMCCVWSEQYRRFFKGPSQPVLVDLLRSADRQLLALRTREQSERIFGK